MKNWIGKGNNYAFWCLFFSGTGDRGQCQQRAQWWLEAQAGTDCEYSATGRDHSTDVRIGLRSGLLLHSNDTFFQDLRRGGKAWNLSKGEMLRHKLWTTSGWIDFHINEKIGRWITGWFQLNSGDKNNSAAAYSLKGCSDNESATSADQTLWDRWNILGMEIILRPRIIKLAT